jgi:MFS family permease
MLLVSAFVLRGVRVNEPHRVRPEANFWNDLKEGARFVHGQPLLVALAWAMGGWQFCQNASVVVQILHATRDLGLSEQLVGLCYAGLGLGTVVASALADRISARWGSGPTLVIGIAICGSGWLLAGLLHSGTPGILAFACMLMLYGVGSVLAYVNFLALRQAATPAPLLGRMTSTMRWLILIPAGPGALLGGYVGEHAGLRYALGLGGVGALALAAWAWRHPVIRNVRSLPTANP